jgi:hypothetical protein
MLRAAVLFAPAGLRPLAEKVAALLDRKRFHTALKPASEAAVTDFSGSDLVLLGCSAQGRLGLPPEFAEILRSLAGINLAGKVAGVFASGSEAPLAAWKKALKDSDIRLEAGNLLRADTADSRTLAAWVGRMAGQLSAKAGER